MKNATARDRALKALLAQRLNASGVAEPETVSIADLLSDAELLASSIILEEIDGREHRSTTTQQVGDRRTRWASLQRAASVEVFATGSLVSLIVAWLNLGLNHVAIYSAATLSLVATALLCIRHHPVLARLLALFACLALPDSIAYQRLRSEGAASLGLASTSELTFPPLLVGLDLLAYLVLLVFCAFVLRFARRRHFDAQREKHRAMRAVGGFSTVALLYWAVIAVGVVTDAPGYSQVDQLIRGVWREDTFAMTGMVFALYGLTACVAFCLPTWDREGYPVRFKWIRHVLRLESTDRVSLSDICRWLSVPPLFYMLFGRHVDWDTAGIVWRAVGVAMVLSLGFWQPKHAG